MKKWNSQNEAIQLQKWWKWRWNVLHLPFGASTWCYHSLQDHGPCTTSSRIGCVSHCDLTKRAVDYKWANDYSSISHHLQNNTLTIHNNIMININIKQYQSCHHVIMSSTVCLQNIFQVKIPFLSTKLHRLWRFELHLLWQSRLASLCFRWAASLIQKEPVPPQKCQDSTRQGGRMIRMNVEKYIWNK